MLRNLVKGLRSLFRKERVEGELDEELRGFLEMAAEEKMKQGISRKDALRAVRLEKGSLEVTKEVVRSAGWESLLETWWQDFRFATRVLRKSPGFTAVAVLTLALGIGANTAIFSIINGLLLRTLPVRDPGRLVELLTREPEDPEPGFNGWSWDAYRIIRDGNHVFSDLIVDSLTFISVRADKLQPQTVFVGQVGGTFFQALGVRPAAGRLISPEDVRMGDHSPVAVISWSFWKSRFDLDPGIIGKKIIVGDTPLTIVGVTQRSFYGLSGHARQDVWWPISLGPSSGMWYGLLGRLKPGVSMEQARAEMAVLFQTIVTSPGSDPHVRRSELRIEPAGNGVTTPLTQMLSTPLTVLMATVGLLLLLACANLAGLLLARGASRQHEIAVRVCLGAARARLLRQTLTESLLLSLVGCAVGVFLAYFAAHALIRVFASGRFIVIAPVRFETLTKPDPHVLLFTGAIAVLTGLLCGAVPAMSASSTAPASALQQASRIGESKSRRRFGKGLVASQVALSLVLVSSAGLFVGYLLHLRNLNLGFERNNLLLVTLDFEHSGYNPAQFARLSEQLVAELETTPGVKSATMSSLSPMEGPGRGASAFPQGHPDNPHNVSINDVAPGYFLTYSTPLFAGRYFSAEDQGKPLVAIMNQAAARDCFGNENPIGKYLTLSHINSRKGEITYQVVGIVENAKYNDIQQPAPATIYRDLLQQDFIGSQLAVRTSIAPDAVAGAVRKIESAVLKTVPIVHIMTMNEQIDTSIVPERLIAMLSGCFGALGALLAAIGLYGLLAYTVARRTHEIGVRRALGAAGTDVMRIIFRDVLWMVCAGLAIGAPLAFWGKRVAASLIPNLPVAGLLPVVVAAAIMVAFGLIAAYLPARRAMRVDPLVALRYE